MIIVPRRCFVARINTRAQSAPATLLHGSEADRGRYKRVIGDALRSRTKGRQMTEVAIAVASLKPPVFYAIILRFL